MASTSDNLHNEGQKRSASRPPPPEILVAQAKQGGATCEPKRGVVDEASKEKELLAKDNNHIPSGKPSKGERKEKPVLLRYLPPIPFPQRLAKEEDLENQGEMPKFSLYLKELLNHKKKLEDISRVVLNEECSAIVESRVAGTNDVNQEKLSLLSALLSNYHVDWAQLLRHKVLKLREGVLVYRNAHLFKTKL
nr:uncharacterized protein LOC110892572 [Ipomoea batatas]